jgi:tetratricopeptide repeat protein 30
MYIILFVFRILQQEYQQHPKSRAALSLLGYCYYYMQEFALAAQM